jgi:selT/selW/selH-like putative selenoprotein
LAEAIKSATGVDAELVKGRGGVFDVEVDGVLIYSKFDTDRFPTSEEIVSQLT